MCHNLGTRQTIPICRAFLFARALEFITHGEHPFCRVPAVCRELVSGHTANMAHSAYKLFPVVHACLTVYSTSKDLCTGCRSDQDLTRTAAAKRTWNLYRTGKYNQGNIHRAATDSLGHWALPASAMDHVDLSLSSLNLAIMEWMSSRRGRSSNASFSISSFRAEQS